MKSELRSVLSFLIRRLKMNDYQTIAIAEKYFNENKSPAEISYELKIPKKLVKAKLTYFKQIVIGNNKDRIIRYALKIAKREINNIDLKADHKDIIENICKKYGC